MTRVARRPRLGPVTAIVLLGALGLALTPAPGSAQSAAIRPADLRIDATEGIIVPRTGGTGLLRVTVANDARSAAPQPTISVTLPAGVAFEPAVPGSSPGCTATDQTVRCEVGAVPPSQTRTVAIGARTGELPLGRVDAVVAAPTSAGWDPDAGELRELSWNHEAGGQGTSLLECWAPSSPSPNMDLDGGATPDVPTEQGCDGVIDRPALAPDAAAIRDAFPPPFSAAVTRSWEWRTRITPAWTDTYRVCAAGIDDGGYVAFSPRGVAPTTGDVALDVATFGTMVEGQVDLVAGTTYDVLIRVSNRGAEGVDNGGAAPGGWGYVGLERAPAPCTPAAADALSALAPGYTPTTPIPIGAVGAAALRTTGTVTDGARQWSVARAVNDGPDATLATASAIGQTAPIPSVFLRPGESTVFASFLDPAAVPAGVVPWMVVGASTLPPAP